MEELAKAQCERSRAGSCSQIWETLRLTHTSGSLLPLLLCWPSQDGWSLCRCTSPRPNETPQEAPEFSTMGQSLSRLPGLCVSNLAALLHPLLVKHPMKSEVHSVFFKFPVLSWH